MEIRVLGPIEVSSEEGVIPVGGPRQRRLVAALAMQADEVLSVDRLADITWSGEELPQHSERNVRTYMHRIRTAVGDDLADRFATAAPGYVLHLEPGELDAALFEQGCAQAARLHEQGDSDGAVSRLDEALRLWRGRPYAEFADEEWARAEVSRLGEVHAGALEVRCQALLDLGRGGEALSALEALIEEHPLRERPRALYMQALYHSGRQAESLRAFQQFRDYLIDEVGVSPTDELVELDRAIAEGSLSQPSGTGHVRGYEIHELIGSGAFADVHRGTQPALQREVAIKSVKAELANRPEFIRGFEAEAAMVARLEHPFIVPLYDFWREPDRAYLVMRWLTGGSLEAALDLGPMSMEQAAQMVEQVGSALAAAHRAGVVHRDVKSANILLDDQGNTYLTDFGIAVEAAGEENPAAALSEGSPAYASPEQLRREEVGPTADIFGLGIAAYEALTGRLPFADAQDRAALLRRQLHEPIPPPSTLRPELPAAIDDVIATATAKDARSRYQHVDQFVEAFVGALAESPAAPAGLHEAARRVTEISGLVDNPYKGLQAFGEGDADEFFGRERLVDELLGHLRGTEDRPRNFLAVIGPSGSGKSSVVRAGVVPALRAGRVDGSDDWFITTMTPGAHPFEALETALLRIAVNPPPTLLDQLGQDRRGIVRSARRILPSDDATAVLVIDQFEEVFTLCESDEVRDRFLEGLAVAATDTASPLRVIVTLRADFYDEPLRHVSVADLFKRDAVTVTPLAADELEQAIVRPAQGVGAAFEPGLVAEIVADVASQPGALPLMQYALRELFDARVSGMLMVSGYRELGGLSGALSRRADELFESLGGPQQAAARRLFGRLVTLGDGSEDTRRRVRRSEVGSDPATESVTDAYGRARLLSFDRDALTREPTVEVAHEALIREWPRLRDWLDEDRDGLRVQRAVTEAAARWLAEGQEEADLLRGGRLEAAVEYSADHGDELNEIEQAFVDASAEARDREADRTRRTNRRLRRLALAVSVVAVLALVAGIVAVVQQQNAAEERDASDVARAEAEASAEQARQSQADALENAEIAKSAQAEAEAAQEEAQRDREAARTTAFDAENARMGAEAQNRLESSPRLALLLAAQAHRRDGTSSTVGALQRTLMRSGVSYIGAQDRQYVGVDWSADGSRIAVAHTQGVEIYDGHTLERSWSADSAAPVMDFGSRGSAAGPKIGFDLDEGGGYAAMATEDGVTVFDLEKETVTVLTHPDEVRSVRFNHGGSSLATGDSSGVVRVWGLPEAAVRLTIDAHLESADEWREEVIDRGGADWAVTAELFPESAGIVRRGVAAMEFSIDDRSLITAEFPTVKVWDAETGAAIDTLIPLYENRFGLVGPQGMTSLFVEGGFGLDPSNPDVVFAVARNDLLKFDWRTGALIDQAALPTEKDDTNSSESGGALIADGTWAVSLSDGRFRILDDAGSPVKTVFHRLARPAAVSASPLGDVVAVAGAAGVALVRLDGSNPLAEAIPKGPANGFITTSADSSIVVESGFVFGPTTMHVRDDSGRYRQVPYPADLVEKSGGVVSLTPTRTSYMVFDIGQEFGVESIYAERDPGAPRFPVYGISIGHAVNPGGTLYANQGSPELSDSSVNVWDTRTWENIAQLPAPGGTDLSLVRSMTFRHDGSALMATTSLGSYRMWRTDTWAEETVDADLGPVLLASFSPDGRFLATVDGEGVITLRDAQTFGPIRTLVGAAVPVDAGGQMRWSDDGSLLLSKFEAEPRLWDTETGLQLGDPFPNDPTVVYDSTIGLSLATLVGDHVLVWNMDPSTWPDIACRAAGRNMTLAEWEQFGPQGEPYETTCDQYPAGT